MIKQYQAPKGGVTDKYSERFEEIADDVYSEYTRLKGIISKVEDEFPMLFDPMSEEYKALPDELINYYHGLRKQMWASRAQVQGTTQQVEWIRNKRADTEAKSGTTVPVNKVAAMLLRISAVIARHTPDNKKRTVAAELANIKAELINDVPNMRFELEDE